MKQFRSYFGLQLKRAGRMVPRMLAVTLLLAVLTALGAMALAKRQAEDPSLQKLRVAVVGDAEEELISEALELLGRMDSSRLSISLERMEEEQAFQLLRRGKLNGCLQVPDGFARALWYGEHLPLTYYTRSGGADVGSQLMRELVVIISSLVLETESAVYGFQDLVRDTQSSPDPSASGDALVMRYAAAILDRDRLFVVEQLGAADSLSLPGYYLCGISLLFVMLWSVSCSPFFSRRSRELGQLLGAQGLGAPGQVLSEFVSFLLLLLLALAAAGLLAALLLTRFGLHIPELQARSGSLLSLLPRFLPPALMLCALQFLLFELNGSTVSAILLQFLNAAVQGYLAGCFYPSSFFPEGLRRLGALLPAGFGMRYLRAGLLSLPDKAAAAGVWLYFLLFLALSLLLRRRRNRS